MVGHVAGGAGAAGGAGGAGDRSPAELLVLLESLLEVICTGTEPDPPGVLAQHARVTCRRLRRQLEHLAVIDRPVAGEPVDGAGTPWSNDPDPGCSGPLELPSGGAVSALGLTVDIDGCRAVVAGRPIELNRAETILSALLVANAGRAVPYELLQREAWRGSSGSLDRLRVAISELRGKLGLRQAGLAVHAVTGIGYRFAALERGT